MKNKRIRLIVLLVIVILVIPVGITFSKYIYNFVGNYLIETKHFYFSSDKLANPTKTYTINNWGGVGTFKIEFQLNNHKNNLLVSDSDIAYNVTVQHSPTISYTINSTSGTISHTEASTHDFTVYITPVAGHVFHENDTASITITATSSSPYIKVLTATFNLVVGKQGITYAIDDVVGQPYLNFTIANARNDYVVATAFSTYSVGDPLTIEEYLALTDADKAKCYSARITLSFNPNTVVIDTTSNIFNNATYSTTTVGGVAYVSTITFDVEPMSSSVIRFYKVDPSQNYTYPNNNSSPSVITFNTL